MHRLTTRTVAAPLSAEQLTLRLARKRTELQAANGEYADDLTTQIRALERMLADAKGGTA